MKLLVPLFFACELVSLTTRWIGPGMLRDLETKLYDVS